MLDFQATDVVGVQVRLEIRLEREGGGGVLVPTPRSNGASSWNKEGGGCRGR